MLPVYKFVYDNLVFFVTVYSNYCLADVTMIDGEMTYITILNLARWQKRVIYLMLYSVSNSARRN